MDNSGSTELAKPMDFKGRFTEKMKGSIDSLISEGELKEMVENCFNKTFFEGRRVSTGYNTTEHLSLVEEVTRELLTKEVNNWVSDHLSKNKDLISEILEKHIEETFDKSVMETVVRGFSRLISGPMEDFATQLRQGLGNNNVFF